MKRKMILYRSFMVYLWINHSYAFITRLPECMYHGDFLKTHDAYQTGKINATIITQIIDWCVIKCIVLVGCVSFNYNINTEECELLSRRYEEIGVKIGWVTGHTDIDKRTIGPTCTSLSPCGQSQKCLDTCEAPGYICQDFVNVAVGKIARQTKTHYAIGSRTFHARHAIDNDLDTFSSTIFQKAAHFYVDLSKSIHVYFVNYIMNLSGPGIVKVAVGERKFHFGSKFNSFCCVADVPSKDCFCNAFGRYLTIYGEDNVQSKIIIKEVKIYT